MKKVLSIFALLLTINVSCFSQDAKIIPIDKSFNKSGHCFIFSKNTKPKQGDQCDLIWELSQKIYEDLRLITLTLKDKEGNAVDYYSWKDGETLILFVSDGLKMYIVKDEYFSHLRLIEIEKNEWGISLSSELIEDWMDK